MSQDTFPVEILNLVQYWLDGSFAWVQARSLPSIVPAAVGFDKFSHLPSAPKVYFLSFPCHGFFFLSLNCSFLDFEALFSYLANSW